MLFFLLVCCVMVLCFLNGFTDSVNSVSSSIFTKTLTKKKAYFYCAFFNFIGCIFFYVFFRSVSNSLVNLSDLSKKEGNLRLALLCSIIVSVCLFALVSYFFSLPTSESHAILGAFCGCFYYINKINLNNFSVIKTIFYEQIFSLIFSFIFFYIFLFLVKYFNIKKSIKTTLCLQAFFQGGQSGQKFFSFILIAIMTNNNIKESYNFIFILLIGLSLFLGVLFSGNKILNKIKEVSYFKEKELLCTDLSMVFSIFVSSINGILVSTSYIKIFSFFVCEIDRQIFKKKGDLKSLKKFIPFFFAFILTFPSCALISYILCFLTEKMFYLNISLF